MGQDAQARPASTSSETARWWRLRLESALLALALFWTLGPKVALLRGLRPTGAAAAWFAATLPDVTFFAAAASACSLLYLVPARRMAARLVLLAASIILAWSVLNAAWLLATGVQLQPGVLYVLARDPVEFWPIVANRLGNNLAYAVPIAITVLAGAVWIGWRLISPAPASARWQHHARRGSMAGVVLVLSVLGGWLAGHGGANLSRQALGFSSHWNALMSSAAPAGSHDDAMGRAIPRAGERRVAAPDPARELPNVVVLLLESVSWEATTLANPALATTPTLARLSSEGATFEPTRAVVPQTSKAMWSVLTGSTPAIQQRDVETVLVDRPYESLATVLAGCGYRSAFFEMARGSFQCPPGLMSNLAFDRALRAPPVVRRATRDGAA